MCKAINQKHYKDKLKMTQDVYRCASDLQRQTMPLTLAISEAGVRQSQVSACLSHLVSSRLTTLSGKNVVGNSADPLLFVLECTQEARCCRAYLRDPATLRDERWDHSSSTRLLLTEDTLQERRASQLAQGDSTPSCCFHEDASCGKGSSLQHTSTLPLSLLSNF